MRSSEEIPRAPSIWEELEAWSETFSAWQKVLLAAAVRSGVIPEPILEQAYSLFLAEHDLAPHPEPYPEIPTSVTGRDAGSRGRARLRAIHSPSGINRLPSSSELTFSDGLTVVYGGNGVGKSGFARILSNACFSRKQHPIYPDVFDEAAPSFPSAIIELVNEDGTPLSLTFDNSSEHPILKRGFVVFDSAVADRHLTETGPLGFVPTGFDVFAEMARSYAVLQSMLAADIERRSNKNNYLLAFDGGKTASSAMISTLGRHTNLEELRALGSFGPSERARLDQLQMFVDQLRGNSSGGTIRRLAEVRPQLVILKERLAETRNALSEQELSNDVGLLREALVAGKALAQLSVDTFAHPSIAAIGSPEWEKLIRASDAFVDLQHSHYPSEGDVCILCHQPLASDAIARFVSYREFAAGEALRRLTVANKLISERRARLLALHLSPVETGSLVQSFLDENYPVVLHAIVETLDAVEELRDSAVSALDGEGAQGNFAVADFDATLDDIIARVDRDLDLLQEKDRSSAIRAAEDELLGLRHREILSKCLAEIVAFVVDAKWVASADIARRYLNPRHLTEKEQALFATVIAEQYRNMLAAECEALSCSFSIEFRTQGRKGQTVRSLLIQNRSPDQILSEGEQRAVALADFLTEVQLNADNVGIILDDPVTSLDHDRKEKIAVRLVHEAKRRQVVVFTHDMVFFAKLCDASDRLEEKITTHWMQRSGDQNLPGMVSLNDGPTTTPQYRNTGFAEDSLAKAKVSIGSAQERLVRQGAGQLRRTVEEIVPQYLFKEVVRRWTDRVMVTALKRVAWDNSLVDDLVELFEACSAMMEGHSHTEDGAQVPPTPAKLEDLIRRAKDLIRRAKVSRDN
ncbi:AAA family ATPase [Bradyrhizobium iriomotense]|uniref:AAA family ATPase n=1 Tax=Bradyrhizobium iriomotense TaxID=441950 RepID=UPI001B8A0889|nr:AAA family ATPase [Bradyrhizobium iriomotense]